MHRCSHTQSHVSRALRRSRQSKTAHRSGHKRCVRCQTAPVDFEPPPTEFEPHFFDAIREEIERDENLGGHDPDGWEEDEDPLEGVEGAENEDDDEEVERPQLFDPEAESMTQDDQEMEEERRLLAQFSNAELESPTTSEQRMLESFYGLRVEWAYQGLPMNRRRKRWLAREYREKMEELDEAKDLVAPGWDAYQEGLKNKQALKPRKKESEHQRYNIMCAPSCISLSSLFA